MAPSTNFNSIIEQLRAYKRKYYLNKLLKGSIFFATIVISIYLLISYAEYSLRLNSPLRAVLLFTFLGLFLYILYRYILNPLLSLYDNKRQIDDEEAARQIGNYFPDIRDKLLNIIQLRRSGDTGNAFIAASISQRTEQLSVFSFPVAINLNDNVSYLRFLVFPVTLLLLLLLFLPQIFSESNTRILHFNKEFVPEAPFSFHLQNESFIAFRNEDYTLQLALEGDAIPDKVYLNTAGRKVKMTPNQAGVYEYTFQNIQRDISFTFDAAGFNSSNYDVKVVDRPNLKNFSVMLDYPDYLNKKNDRLNNVGNLQIPEGTNVGWEFNTLASDSLSLFFSETDTLHQLTQQSENIFSFEKQVFKSDSYLVNLKNSYSSNKQEIRYHLDVIPDQPPTISLEQFQDTTLYQFMIVGGNVADDYGLTRLALYYKVEKSQDDQKADRYNRINLPLNTSQNSQSYYYRWQTDSFNLKPGDKIEYFLQVWDNDGVNGSKSAKTSSYTFRVPDKEQIKENLEKSSSQTQSQITKTVQQANELKEQLEEAEKKLRGKKELTWQDKQMLEELMKKREELNEEIQKLQEQSRSDNMKRDQFTEQSDKIKEKVDQLQSLMDELLDEETKQLYEELKKLLEEQKGIEELQDKLREMTENEETLEEELERALELFKRMKFDMKLDEVINELDEFSEEQQDLSEKTEDKSIESEELTQQQDSLNQKFDEDVEKSLEELNELNQDLKNPNPMQDFSPEQQDIKEEQQKAKESLEQNQRKDAKQSQQKSMQQMQKMSDKLQQMQESMEVEMLQENIDNLRNILDNLVTLSFSQEDVMKSFREVRQTDPRFIELSQEQLKLRDDAQIIEDSLLSLAERVFQIQSFVTREVKDMNQHMDESMGALRERQQFKAISKQQFAMTSINNLALLLNDVLSQMQQAMADAMGNPKKNQNPSQGGPSMSELQKQLNDQIEQLKKSGKSGRQLSEELAKLAAKQEQIRRALQEMQESESQNEEGSGGNLNELIKKMEETELDLVNKKLSSEMQKRQKEIVTRLLEAEESIREQELDDERKGETAKEYERISTESFEEYIKAKQQEIDLLKTVPVQLNPYYKNEANKYFQRINE